MSQNRALGIGLGFTAGYVDTVGFVALFGLFTAHVTGNFVLIGSELARPSHGVLIKFLAFPAFVGAVALTRMIVIWLERSGKAPLRTLFAVQVSFLTAFMLLGYFALPIQDTEALIVLLAGMSGAAAMGVQNAASRLALSDIAPTTVMTGNVTQLVIDLVDILRGSADTAVRGRITKFLWPIVAFGVGAIGGAFAYVHLQFWALLLPIVILGWFAVSE
ncbi:YoaK family protein [Undibacterium sp. TJN25]|uniref:YoaK family protein n=1 Tax=Undibacterium sp. TJN25 TaxID=3413056 RepID=UPI003BF20105